MIGRTSLVLVGWLLATPAAAQLPPYVEAISEGACLNVVTAASASAAEALATGCALMWWDPMIDEVPEDQRFARRAAWVELEQVWLIAQVNNRGHYGPRPAEVRNAPAGGAVASWTGSGSKDTESFSVSSAEWRIRWSATATSSVGGALSISVYGADGERVASTDSDRIQGQRSGSSVVRAPPGRYYLSILSANLNWRIDVIP